MNKAWLISGFHGRFELLTCDFYQMEVVEMLKMTIASECGHLTVLVFSPGGGRVRPCLVKVGTKRFVSVV